MTEVKFVGDSITFHSDEAGKFHGYQDGKVIARNERGYLVTALIASERYWCEVTAGGRLARAMPERLQSLTDYRTTYGW